MGRRMTVQEKLRVIEFEKRERYCLKEILDSMKLKNPNYKYSMYLSPIDSDTPYDAILTIKNEDDVIIKTYIIEVKNRTRLYVNMYLEKKKLNALKKVQNSLELELGRKCELLYINISEHCTFIFSLDEMELGKCTRESMSSESFSDINVKRNKLVYSLPLKEAIKIKFKYNEEDYLRSIEPVKIAPVEKTKEIKTYSLF